MSDVVAIPAIDNHNLTFDASDTRFYAESNRGAYLQIHADDPVYWVEAAHTQPFWNVCNHDLIRQVGQDCELFTTEYGVHGVHLNAAAFDVKSATPEDSARELPTALRPANVMDAADHRRVRGPVNTKLRPGAVANLEAAIRSDIRGLLARVTVDEPVNFMTEFATRVPLVVTTRLLGVSADREKDFEHWAGVILESFEPGAQPDFAAIGEMGRSSTPRSPSGTERHGPT